jgi:hypothetical protein
MCFFGFDRKWMAERIRDLSERVFGFEGEEKGRSKIKREGVALVD